VQKACKTLHKNVELSRFPLYFVCMKPIDHFFSQIDSVIRSFRGNNLIFTDREGQQSQDRLMQAFSSLTAPVIGKAATNDICLYCINKLEGEKPETLQKLSFIAAFLLGEYDDKSMNLDTDDWNEIKETLNDVSGEINLDTLTELLGDLLNRGKLE
jgi:hypothetical protein